MRAAKMYATAGAVFDPKLSYMSSVSEVEEQAVTAQYVLEKLEEADSLLERYQDNVAEQGRIQGLQETYDDEDYVAFFDEDGRQIDAFTVGVRQQHVADEQEHLEAQLDAVVDDLLHWGYGYEPEDGAEAANQSIAFLYTFTRRGIGQEMIDPGLVQEFKEENPDVFFDLYPLTDAGEYVSQHTVLDTYMTDAGSLRERSRHDVLEQVAEEGVDALEEAFQDRAEKEASFVQALYEDEAQPGDTLTQPVPFRVKQLSMSDAEQEAYEQRAARMFQ